MHLLSFCFPALARGHHKVEEACEMYCRAANMFKMAKNWSGAISSFLLKITNISISTHFSSCRIMCRFFFFGTITAQRSTCEGAVGKNRCHYVHKSGCKLNAKCRGCVCKCRFQCFYYPLSVFSCWKCVLQGSTSPYAAAEQT